MEEELKEIKIIQFVIFLYSIVKVKEAGDIFVFEGVVGYSLGEFLVFVVVGVMDFVDGFKLVYVCVMVMQEVCEMQESIMVVVIGMEDQVVEDILV